MAEKKKRGPGRPPGSKNKKKPQEPPVDKQAKVQELQQKKRADKKVIDEIWAVTIFAIGVFLVFTTQLNTTGAFGEAIHDVLRGLFGIMAYVLPYYFMITALLLFFQKMQHINGRTVFFSVLIFFMICILNAYRFIDVKDLRYGFHDIATYYQLGVSGKQAGVFGMEFGSILVKFFGMPGLLIIAITVIIISLLLVANNPISEQITQFKEKREAKKLVNAMKEEELAAQAEAASNTDNKDAFRGVTPSGEVELGSTVDVRDRKSGSFPDIVNTLRQDGTGSATDPVKDKQNKDKIVKYVSDDGILSADGKAGNKNASKSLGLDGESAVPKEGFGLSGYGADDIKNVASSKNAEDLGKAGLGAAGVAAAATAIHNGRKDKLTDEDNAVIEKEVEAGNTTIDGYRLPPVELLKKPKGTQTALTDQQLEQRATLLEDTLNNFNVDAKVVRVTQGASVTRYEVQPAVGVKVNSIVRLADDIALNLRAKSIRIEAPIPGKAAVGIEVENAKPSAVLIRELLSSDEFINAKSRISFALGKDISGNNIVADLYDMPHLLIAGATGSGKSVCINTIITSILYKARPDEVKMVLIDPKVVELGHYNGIPHMLIPVVTDPKKAAAALNWAVNEMTQRYKKFAEVGVKDLTSYNELMKANQEKEKAMPQVVIIIDELADLMMAAPSQVEESICRLAQMARAAGMHLIVATQRPSVDIVTGVIKANIPSRIAFSVSSQFDSRTILDTSGAEKLLGKGDMLFSPMGSNKQTRIQGAYISDSETAKVIEFVKKQATGSYNEEVIKTIEMPEKGTSNSATDELTEDAIAFILKQKQASVSMLQRRFRIGYNRAARIIDEIEDRGIIGPSDGSRPRQLLIGEDEYYSSMDESEEETDNE